MTFRVPTVRLPHLPRRGRTFVIALVAIIVAIILVATFVSIYTDLLWYRSVGYAGVFSRRLTTELLLFFVFGVAMMAIVGANIYATYRLRPAFRPASPEQQQLDVLRQGLAPFRYWIIGAILLLIGAITGSAAAGRWRTWMQWRSAVKFGIKDPQFHRDISYFAFTYPMQRFVLGMLFAAVIVSLIAVLLMGYLMGGLRPQTPGPKVTPALRAHISVLLGAFVLLKAVAYWLDRYGLAFSGRGIVTGPSYTDVNAVLPAKTILVFVAVICAGLFFANVRTRNWRLPAIAFGLMVLSAIVIGGAYPALVEQFKVKPSAQDLEAKYIHRNIVATQAAYGLTPATVKVDPTYSGVSTEPNSTLRKQADSDAQLRVLDPNVVSRTFAQLQQQRSFYSFAQTLDVDRYNLSGQLSDVVIGTREINIAGLQPSQQNWINEHLVYTHGYGVVAALADTSGDDGKPDFVEQNLPPTGVLGDFQPRIYFGENSPAYSIVGAPNTTTQRELDLPSDSGTGQTNTTYTGTGGISIGSTFRQLLYALKFKDKNLLLSSGVNNDSRLLYVRDPRDRVKKVAPWLTLDGDPYPVVSGGRILWVVDGYTTSSGYPYSEQTSLASSTQDTLTARSTAVAAQANQQINYIRNSVKATVDAYDGTVKLYEWNEPSGQRDPVLATWMKAFPGVVKPESAIPADLMTHLRYPEDLFNVQRSLLARYHETNAKAFFNGTDFWKVPLDPTVNGSVAQPPYYLSVAIPGASSPVFSLTSPLVSLNLRNLTAYLAVDSQPGPSYGQMSLLELPANQTVDGPGQVQNNIESDPTVSTQLTLLRGGGSSVVLGNLLTVPLGGGLLYVEPIYVQAGTTTGQSFPILRKIVAVYGNTIAYENTLPAALDVVFGAQPPTTTPTSPTPAPTGSGGTNAALNAAIAAAQQAEADAVAALKSGDFAAYGEAEKRLQQAIAQIAAAANRPSSTPSPAPTPSAKKSP